MKWKHGYRGIICWNEGLEDVVGCPAHRCSTDRNFAAEHLSVRAVVTDGLGDPGSRRGARLSDRADARRVRHGEGQREGRSQPGAQKDKLHGSAGAGHAARRIVGAGAAFLLRVGLRASTILWSLSRSWQGIGSLPSATTRLWQ